MKNLIATLLIGAMAGVPPGCADILGTRMAWQQEQSPAAYSAP